jgi:monomeric isocitrate dehydrogenase
LKLETFLYGARILAKLQSFLTEIKKTGDALLELGQIKQLTLHKITKRFGICSSIKAAIAELQSHGYNFNFQRNTK